MDRVRGAGGYVDGSGWVVKSEPGQVARVIHCLATKFGWIWI